MALMCAPGEIHSRRNTGSREVVAVTIRSAPRTAASTLATGSIETADCGCISLAKFFAFSKLRAAMRTRLSGRAQIIADRCERACTPAPIMARSHASSRDKRRVASPLTAAVRIAVIAEALTTASNSPVSPSKSITPPWWASFPIAALPGKTQIAFKPNNGDGLAQKVGIIANTPLTPVGLKIVRNGC